MNSLAGNSGLIFLLVFIIMLGISLPDISTASDRDVDPYMIYVDPVTGKYTTIRPGHDSTGKTEPAETKAESTEVNKPRANATSVIFISAGILFISQMIALLLKAIRKRVATSNERLF